MDINLDKNEISICNMDLISGEQAFESDILLPDYYQDIMKILKCHAMPVVTKSNLLNNKVVIDGMVSIKIYYQTVENKIRTISSKINFSKVFEVEEYKNDLYIFPQLKLDYVNCRAVNERKIDIKGAISISVKLFYNSKEDMLESAEGAGLQIKKDVIKTMAVIGSNNNQFNLKEEVVLDSNKPDIGNVIRYEFDIICNEKKVIDNKIVFKGNVEGKVLYSQFNEDDESELPVVVDFVLPINQIVDLSGLVPGDDCHLNCDLIWAEITPKANSDGKNRSFVVDVSFNAVVKCHKEITTNFILDAYSTLKEVENNYKVINCYKILNKIDETVMVEANVSILGASGLKVLDVWNTPKIVFTKTNDGSLIVEGKTELSILGLQDDIPIYIEKFIDFQTSVPIKNLDAGDIRYDLEVKNRKINYSLNNDSMDLKIDLNLEGYIYQNKVKNVITDIKVSENDKVKEKNDNNSLIVYYAQPGEDVWELAKKYNTNISAILNENEDLEEGIIKEKRMLLIPVVN